MAANLKEGENGIKRGGSSPDAERIRAVLDAIRSGLLADGGNVELKEVDPDGTVLLELQGACQECPSAEMTLRRVIEPALRTALPELRAVRIASPSE